MNHTEVGQGDCSKARTRRTQAGFSLKDLTAKSSDQKAERTCGNLSLCTRTDSDSTSNRSFHLRVAVMAILIVMAIGMQ